jgi:RNA-directed DNA polymerase
MDFENYKTDFTNEAKTIGFTEQEIKDCLDYAAVLFSHRVPVIYNTTHLSELLGYKKEYIQKASHYPKFYYRNFEITKKNGSKRPISEPLPSLKEIQHWILRNILYQVPVSRFAKAYKPKTRLKENLKFHINQPKVITLDIENFFPSIKTKAIEKVFHDLGYSRLVSKTLSRLCTLDDSLPQGASTSPYLSNLIFKEADAEIFDFCRKRKIRYTRYADDLSFSGDFDEVELFEKILEIIKNLNLKLNKNKTKMMLPNTRQMITGIVVNKKPQVLFQKRNELRQALYYIQKFGINEHCIYKNIIQKNYIEHLLGKVNFVIQINPKDAEFIRYKAFLIDLKQNLKLKILEEELALT